MHTELQFTDANRSGSVKYLIVAVNGCALNVLFDLLQTTLESCRNQKTTIRAAVYQVRSSHDVRLF